MNKKRIAVFGMVGLLISSVAASVSFDDISGVDVTDDYISDEMSKAYDKVTTLQLEADIEAIDNKNGVDYSMLGC